MDGETPARDPVERAARSTLPNNSDLAAEERDVAALARDQAAEARDTASADTGDAQHAARDRVAAAGDRAAAVSRDGAAFARDQAAEARDTASADTGGPQQAARDRVAAARDRDAAAGDRKEAALDRHGAADQLQNAYRDDLTGLLLRGAGRDQLRHAVDRAHRTGEPLVFAFLDVDQLKGVNDVQGHASGDHLLREIGASLRQNLRSYDVAVRYGGDEFICALPGAHLDEAERRFAAVGEYLSNAIAGASISLGLAELQAEEGLEQVIGRADREMYTRRRTRQTSEGRPSGDLPSLSP